MSRTTPAETKLLICVWHPFTEWRPTAAGVAQLMYPELRDSGIMVTNPSGIFSVPMAEHTMGLLLALARNFPDSVRGQDRARWSQQEIWDKPQHLTELNGKVLLIVGSGSIGQEVAKRAKAFDMRVWGVTRSGAGERAHVEKIFTAAQLQEALPGADYVLICAPESPMWKAPNLFLTPHTSGVSDRLWDRQTEILIELLERWFEGRELFNRVDFARGY